MAGDTWDCHKMIDCIFFYTLYIFQNIELFIEMYTLDFYNSFFFFTTLPKN